jgi:hypothetical protein
MVERWGMNYGVWWDIYSESDLIFGRGIMFLRKESFTIEAIL